jgi:hypothetical protein
MTAVIVILYCSINENVLGQQQQPTNNTGNLETIIQQNNRIIQQNDETAIQERAGTYIGTIALLVSNLWVSTVAWRKNNTKGKTTLPNYNTVIGRSSIYSHHCCLARVEHP